MSDDKRLPADATPAAPATNGATKKVGAGGTPPLSKERRQQARRRVLRTILLTGGVMGAALSGFLPLIYTQKQRLRPPGALDEKDFLSSCIKCGQCVQVCPVSAIKLADLVDGIGVGAPYIDARAQACDFSCDAVQCILACPTGSLTYEKPDFLSVRAGAAMATKPILLAKEQDAEPTLNLAERIGVARLTRPEICLAIQGKGFKGQARGSAFKGRLRYMDVDRWKPIKVADHPYDVAECDLCVRECPVKGAISIETVFASDGTQRKSPVVHEPCVGCGVCEMICPVEPAAIEIVPGEVWRTAASEKASVGANKS
ncbi:MAG: 4Fe-4S dicluster domain-containing protein [Gammaproteobacteria bacterium]|nr:4Fe-4S dicluster domain-containing protein [Rhodocyclaceae bacterium]MBU3909134.1 4Fe-4S dicluster domain-containing protein [Gammaproteobacteria bacterium]MBU3988357.1 4Fe-4S dicluster domain-containing protein [Gammaproteobacteria bacterium]MBU4005706.1 4Fe-4S dicluster domain-containing protein [Gammaproteobacteria bacterium]MBU4020741.1 4Fe-4S dicluster domain-containing protein [Gammaproteobacteria bacterium]